jgi:hypothetical protein
MTIGEKYLEALKQTEGWVKVSEWAIRVGELYPELLEAAEKQAASQANETTGLREIAARISSTISSGKFEQHIEIDPSEKPRLVRYVAPEEHAKHSKEDLDDDVAPLKRGEIIKQAEANFTTAERYRVAEFESIAAQLKSFFGLSFEVDHAQALLNQQSPGPHHPDNLQLLLKAHNSRKNNQNWERFSISEQVDYIESTLKMQSIIAERLGVDLVAKVQESLMQRLKDVF